MSQLFCLKNDTQDLYFSSVFEVIKGRSADVSALFLKNEDLPL